MKQNNRCHHNDYRQKKKKRELHSTVNEHEHSKDFVCSLAFILKRILIPVGYHPFQSQESPAKLKLQRLSLLRNLDHVGVSDSEEVK